MTDLLKSIHRRLDDIQRRRGFRITATALAVLLSAALFGPLVMITRDLDVQRGRLEEALSGQSIESRDPHAVSLLETGTVRLGDRVFTNETLAGRPELIFGPDGTVDAAAIAPAMLFGERPDWAPAWLVDHVQTTLLLACIVIAWFAMVIWLGLSVPFLYAAAGTGLGWLVARGLGGPEWALAVAGMGSLTFTFVLVMRLALIVLGRPNPMFAVAHTVIKEASRTKVALVFVVLILIMLPLLPLGLDPASPLRFRIQTFISRGMGFTFYLAACMTIVLSCASVAFEIRDRQIWQLVTKPVTRFQYLFGKWIGVATVNLALLLIAATSIFVYVQYLREQPVAPGEVGSRDRLLVRDAVLTARVGRKPDYYELTAEQIRAATEKIIRDSPELAALEEVPLAMRRQIAAELQNANEVGQRTVPPGNGMQEYTFSGLDAARRSGASLTLRYRFHIMRDDEHEVFPALFIFNQDPNLVMERRYVPTMSHDLSLPPSLIREDGTLTIAIVNRYVPDPRLRGAGSLNFEAKDFELLYTVGTFEGNFARAIVLDWTKLVFLAMLGISCATFLSFPVACLTSFTVFAAGTIGPFLADSLEQFYPVSIEHVDWGNAGMVIRWAFVSAIRAVAQIIVFTLQSFGDLRPQQALVEGRLIPLSTVVGGVLRVGLVWSGGALLIGWLVMRGRQLAIYSGHG